MKVARELFIRAKILERSGKIFLLAALLLSVPILVSARNVTLAWNPNLETDLKGYRVYVGSQSQNYSTPIDVGNVTTYVLSGLADESDHYIAVTAYDLAGNESRFSEEVMVSALPPSNQVILLSDDFSDGKADGWQVVDETTKAGPSDWVVLNGELVQRSNIYGTYLYRGDRTWTDYEVTLRMRSIDNDALGLIFHYQDANNYYRFSMSSEDGYRRLIKKKNGTVTTLASIPEGYIPGQEYHLWVKVIGGVIEVSLDGKLLFQVADSSLPAGAIALYSWGNSGAYFDDVAVVTSSFSPPSPPPPGPGALLSDDFSDGQADGWQVVDETTKAGPSHWGVLNGELVQRSNIYGTYLYRGDRTWTDYEATLRMRSIDNDALGLMFHYQDANNYYRFLMSSEDGFRRLIKKKNGTVTTLASIPEGYIPGQAYALRVKVIGGVIEVSLDGKLLFQVADSSLPAGAIALYSWGNSGAYFDDVVVTSLP